MCIAIHSADTVMQLCQWTGANVDVLWMDLCAIWYSGWPLLVPHSVTWRSENFRNRETLS